MVKHKKQYSAEFKQDAVEHYHSSGKSLEQVSGDLKVSK
ncbi:transposase [Desulfosporosinus sp. SB140]